MANANRPRRNVATYNVSQPVGTTAKHSDHSSDSDVKVVSSFDSVKSLRAPLTYDAHRAREERQREKLKQALTEAGVYEEDMSLDSLKTLHRFIEESKAEQQKHVNEKEQLVKAKPDDQRYNNQTNGSNVVKGYTINEAMGLLKKKPPLQLTSTAVKRNQVVTPAGGDSGRLSRRNHVPSEDEGNKVKSLQRENCSSRTEFVTTTGSHPTNKIVAQATSVHLADNENRLDESFLHFRLVNKCRLGRKLPGKWIPFGVTCCRSSLPHDAHIKVALTVWSRYGKILKNILRRRLNKRLWGKPFVYKQLDGDGNKNVRYFEDSDSDSFVPEDDSQQSDVTRVTRQSKRKAADESSEEDYSENVSLFSKIVDASRKKVATVSAKQRSRLVFSDEEEPPCQVWKSGASDIFDFQGDDDGLNLTEPEASLPTPGGSQALRKVRTRHNPEESCWLNKQSTLEQPRRPARLRKRKNHFRDHKNKVQTSESSAKNDSSNSSDDFQTILHRAEPSDKNESSAQKDGLSSSTRKVPCTLTRATVTESQEGPLQLASVSFDDSQDFSLGVSPTKAFPDMYLNSAKKDVQRRAEHLSLRGETAGPSTRHEKAENDEKCNKTTERSSPKPEKVNAKRKILNDKHELAGGDAARFYGKSKPKLSDPSDDFFVQEGEVPGLIQCPLCQGYFSPSLIEMHASSCEGPKNLRFRPCLSRNPIHTSQKTTDQIIDEVTIADENLSDELGSKIPKPSPSFSGDMARCYICNKTFLNGIPYQDHAKRCLVEKQRNEEQVMLQRKSTECSVVRQSGIIKK